MADPIREELERSGIDWQLEAAKNMVVGLRHMQHHGIMPKAYGTSIPDTLSMLIRRSDPDWREPPRASDEWLKANGFANG